TVVSRALRGLSNPSRCRFFAKNSLTAISFCFVAIDSAVAGARAAREGEGRDVGVLAIVVEYSLRTCTRGSSAAPVGVSTCRKSRLVVATPLIHPKVRKEARVQSNKSRMFAIC